MINLCKIIYRYVNHSSYKYDNCIAKNYFDRGIYRIGLFALRDIQKNEELFFDYKIVNMNITWLNKYNKYYKN